METRTALTWNELADLYDRAHHGGRPARTLPMETVFTWAAEQTERFQVSEEGTLYPIDDKRGVDPKRVRAVKA